MGGRWGQAVVTKFEFVMADTCLLFVRWVQMLSSPVWQDGFKG